MDVDNVEILETVILPVSITTVESESFINCEKLINFYYLSTSTIESEKSISECSLLNEIKVNTIYQGNTGMNIKG